MKLSPEIESLSFVDWSQLDNLPNCPAIYFAVDAKNIIQYIGQAQDVHKRWKNHHRNFQLDQINEKYSIRLYWIAWNKEDLRSGEKYFIKKYQPLLNSTEIKTPKVVPSEVILRQLLKKISQKICVLGISENPTTHLKTVYAKFDATNCTAKGAAAVIKKFKSENKSSSLKMRWSKYTPTISGMIYRVASREARRDALENRTYNNHWEIACNGVILDITPENGIEELALFKERAIRWKLANITTRALTEKDFVKLQSVPYMRRILSPLSPVDPNTDPLPILWKNWKPDN